MGIKSIALAISISILSAGANAAIVNVLYEGNIDYLQGAATSALSIGDSFSATLIYDTDFATGIDYVTEKHYNFPTSPTAFSLNVQMKSFTGSANDGLIQVFNDYGSGYDRFQPLSTGSTGFSGDSVSGSAWTQTTLSFVDTDGSVFVDQSLPSALPLLSEFEQAFATMFIDGGIARAQITSMTDSTIPVPAAAWLFGSGLIGLAGFARRSKA
jgi:hypothetical protein